MIAVPAGVAAAALSVSPVRLKLSGAASRTITIANAGNAPTALEARAASFGLDRRGRPTVARASRGGAGWLRVRPARIVLAPGAKAMLTVSSTPPVAASPGDHAALVLLTTEPRRAAGVAIRIRLGVAVFVRVPGRIVYRLALGAIRARRPVLDVPLANRGNVIERTRVRIVLSRGGRVLRRLGPVERMLLPHSRGIEHFRYGGRLHGWVRVRVEAGALRRTLRLRL